MLTTHYGYHLIELLITLVIIGILTTIAIPTYSNYLVQERRLEAAGVLTKLAVALEQYHVQNNTYQSANLSDLHFSDYIVKNHYQLIIQSATENDYQLMAKPLGNQAGDDTRCGALLLNHQGEKGVTGEEKVETCW